MSGPTSATHALLLVYDIFGYSPQILQGADMLAASDSKRQYKVFMPDFWDGKPAPLEWYPPDTKEKEEKLDAFFAGPGEVGKNVRRLMSLRDDLQRQHPEIEVWGLVASFATLPHTPFKACAQLHPGFAEAEIARQITIPTLALCSKDETDEEIEPFKSNLKVANRFETFPEMVHGWLAARGDLADEDVRKDFQKGYKMVLEWFAEHL